MIIRQRVRNKIRTSDGICFKIQTCNSEGSKLCGRPLMSELSRLVSNLGRMLFEILISYSPAHVSLRLNLFSGKLFRMHLQAKHISSIFSWKPSKNQKIFSLSMDSLKKPWLSSIILVNYEFHGFYGLCKTCWALSLCLGFFRASFSFTHMMTNQS